MAKTTKTADKNTKKTAAKKEEIINKVEESNVKTEEVVIENEEVGTVEDILGNPESEITTPEPEIEELVKVSVDDPDFNAVEEEVAEKREDLDIIKVDHNDEPEKKNVFVAKPLCTGNRYHQKVIVKKYHN